MARGSSGESVLDRAVRILAAFTADEPALTVTQLSTRTGLHLATTSRLVRQLTDLGLLARDADGGVRIGMRMWELSARAAPTRGLREAALPFLEDLHAVVGHHAQLAIREGAEVLFVERLSSPGAVINYSQVAGRLPLHASSSGLVLLAAAPAELQEEMIARPLVAFTPETITDPRRLRAVLAEVRRQGYALNAGHIHPDATGVAVPIRDAKGHVVAAVSVIVPNRPEARATIGMLQAAARGISRSLIE
ncbi:IclR family transcriptional regulator [Actinoplanes sp. CA-142083]|uniref:IclR family transcriptional regulator n=1 Tax=Actinoplanes sp. CA-142083 TaxID=3239903 RepID=UPI003D8D6623